MSDGASRELIAIASTTLGPYNLRVDAKVCSAVVLLFGVWTAVAHVCTLLGGGLAHLTIAYGLVLLVGFRPGLRLIRAASADDAFVASTDPRFEQRWLVALAVLGALVAWFARHPDADDAIYLNLAVTAADSPKTALASADGIFGLAAPSPLLRPYALHSIELAAGSLRILTGVDSRFWMHVALPPLAGAFTVLAQIRLAREFMGRSWFATTCLVLLFLFLVGDGWQSHGRHGFGRMHQGKTLLVEAFLPLCLVYVARLHESPRARNGVMLWLVSEAAIGCSANALILVPVLLALSHLALTGRGCLRHGSARWVLLSVLTTGLLATWAYGYRTGIASAESTGGMDVAREVILRALGNSVLAAATLLFALVGAWRVRHRRVMWLLLAVVFVFTVNPLFAGGLNRAIDRPGVLPRSFWLIPVPLLVAAGVIQVAEWRPGGRSSAWWVGGILLLTVFLLVPGERPLRAVVRRPPGRLENVPPWLGVAEAVVTRTRNPVLAPPQISAWIPTLHHHPPVVFSRPLYEIYLVDRLGAAEAENRRRLSWFVDGRDEPAVDCRQLRQLEVDLVVARQTAANAREWLKSCGFDVVQRMEPWEVWERSSPSRW